MLLLGLTLGPDAGYLYILLIVSVLVAPVSVPGPDMSILVPCSATLDLDDIIVDLCPFSVLGVIHRVPY